MNERLQLTVVGLRVAGPAGAIAFYIAWFLHNTGKLGTAGALGIVLLGLALGFALGCVVGLASGSASKHIVRTVTAAGNLTPSASYSYEESLVARGKLAEAREAYEIRLEREPRDLNARLALARLWRDQLGGPGEAERLYLAARRLGPSADQEFAIGNALIDLYRSQGERGREMAELARFAERFAGSEAGERALRALRRLKPPAPEGGWGS